MIDIATKQRIEATQTATKIRLERRLSRVILNNYAELIREFDAIYPAIGAAPVIDSVIQSTQQSLEAHYLIVQRQFEGQVSEDIGEPLPEQAMTLGAFAFGVWISQRSFLNAARIITTARNRILAAIGQAREQAASGEVGSVLSNQDALDQGKRIAAPVLRRQAGVVGNTETQAAAEATKTFIAEAASGGSPRNVAGTFSPAPLGPDEAFVIYKQWQTRLDERVRNRHVVTEAQVRLASDLFDVDGQAMMHPGDTSFGATLDNVINCRCSALYARGRP